MRIIRTYGFVLLLFILVMGMERTPLYSQTLTLSYSSHIQFNLPEGNATAQRTPGGDLGINLSCVPGPGSQTCPTTVSIYLDLATCGLQSTSGTADSIPFTAVEVGVNSGAIIPLDSPAPPLNNGCGAELYSNAAFNPTGTTYPAFMYIYLRNISVPAGVIYQGEIMITVETQ